MCLHKLTPVTEDHFCWAQLVEANVNLTNTQGRGTQNDLFWDEAQVIYHY